MNIIACFKVVPEEADIIAQENGALSFERAKLAIGSYDLNGIEAGVRLAEEKGGCVTGLSVGAAKIDESKLKKNALSRGFTDLYLVADDGLADADAHQTALALKAAIEKIGPYDLILCGEGSSDLYAQQVGAQLGALLGIASVNSIRKLEAEGEKLRVERVLEYEAEVLEVELPALLSVTSDCNLPRIPSMKNILAAAKKPSVVYNLADVNAGGIEKTIEILETRAPKQTERKQDIIEGDAEDALQSFIAKLAAELK